MQNILRELYAGNLDPASCPVENPEYRQARQRLNDIYDQLEHTLSPNQRETWNKLWAAECKSSFYEDEQLFLTGFRMGMRMAAESLV